MRVEIWDLRVGMEVEVDFTWVVREVSLDSRVGIRAEWVFRVWYWVERVEMDFEREF